LKLSLKEKKIGVIMGGLSSERNVSMKSGAAVLDALRRAGLHAVALDVCDETEEGIRCLISEHAVDIVFVAMHGGFGEGGPLQHILDKIRVPYTGPRETASRLAMDKIVARRFFKKAGLSVPRYRRIPRKCPRFLSRYFLIAATYPCVVKPSAQGSSIGISFLDSVKNLGEALENAFKYGDDVLVEEFIRGREITVSVLDGQALPVVEIIPKKKFFDFQAKYEKGLTDYVVPASLDEKIFQKVQRDAVSATRALGCRHLSRVDMIIDARGVPYVLEVNTIPGMTATSLFPKAAAAAGIDFTALCLRLLELSLQDHGQE
jgi:D-alanine--D-alanine ligase